MKNGKPQIDAMVMNEVQLVLAEKRTSLSVLRTGIAVFALPLSVLSVLIATSRYYYITQVLPMIVPLMLLNVVLVVFGSYLIIRAVLKMRHYDRMIGEIKTKYRSIAELID
jgi:uncharacterized membrane protein YidH (DUF202 family)